MRQNPLVPISSSTYEKLEGADTFVNATRWNVFRFWAVDLGFAQSSAMAAQTEEGAIIANPTGVIGETVRTWHEAGTTIPVRAFLDRLHSDIPLIPYQNAENVQDPMGQAVSWALLGVHYRGLLELSAHADAVQVFLTDQEENGGHRSVSHVTLKEQPGE